MKHDGGWVFISHSHKDIETVRKIRNALETKGFEPLLFYLKCLTDEDEIEDLIRREIDEREWFIYVDSANSRDSKWVQTERDYIRSLSGKRIFTIDLSKNINEQINHIIRQLTVFISYHRMDREVAAKITDRLVKDEFLVVNPTDVPLPGEGDFSAQAKQAIDSSVRQGFVLLIVSERTCSSPYVMREIKYTLKNGGKLIPIYLDHAHLSDDFLSLVGDLQGIRISSNPTPEELDKLSSEILARVDYYQSDFTTHLGFQNAVTIVYPSVGRIDDYTFWDCDNLKEVTIPPAVRYISEKAFSNDQDILIKCEKDSYAEEFCQSHNMRYVLVD